MKGMNEWSFKISFDCIHREVKEKMSPYQKPNLTHCPASLVRAKKIDCGAGVKMIDLSNELKRDPRR